MSTLFRVYSLLSRPELPPHARAHLRALARPVPRLPNAGMLFPLFSHHLARAGIPEEQVLQGPPFPRESMQLIARQHYARLRVQRALIDSIVANGAHRVVFFKGASLAPLYPSPALRQMSDLDVLVAPPDLPPLRRALASSDWRRTNAPEWEVWTHTTGLNLDIHLPASRLAHDVLRTSRPFPGLERGVPIRTPSPHHHLLLLALHAARNGGNRIWRDIADVRVLLSHSREDTIPAARALARTTEERTALAAMLAFLDLTNGHRTPLSGDAADLLATYVALATDRVSPAELGLLSLVWRNPIHTFRSLLSASPQPAAEQDPSLGQLPATGTLARQLLKLRLFLRLASTPQWPRYRRWIAWQRHFEKTRPTFRAPT